MSDVASGSPTPQNRSMRAVLLVLALLTSPALCCSGLQLLDALPSSWMPASLDFVVNLFENSVRVENKTSETLYITAITTTYGEPRVIPQNIGFRQRSVPAGPQGSIVLTYDSADLPLSGIVVCRTAEDCRLLPVNNSGMYEVNSYEDLEIVPPGWWAAVQAAALYNYGALLIAALSLVSISLFGGWLYLIWRERKTNS